MRILWLLAAAFLIAGPQGALAQRVSLDSVLVGDTTVVHTINLRDGTSITGRITSVGPDSVRIQMRAGTVSVARSEVRRVIETSSRQLHNGEVWFENPHASRLIFSPTAMPLRKGEGYFSDIYLFFVGAQWGITDRVSVGGGASLFPLDDFSDNVFYLTPKVTVIDAPSFTGSLGGLFGWSGAISDELNRTKGFGILYGVGSVGSRDTNLSAGLGWGYYGGSMADTPVLMLGGQARLSRRVSLITENWILRNNSETNGLYSYGLRFLGERMAVDLAFVNALSGEDGVHFPGIPIVGFAIFF